MTGFGVLAHRAAAPDFRDFLIPALRGVGPTQAHRWIHVLEFAPNVCDEKRGQIKTKRVVRQQRQRIRRRVEKLRVQRAPVGFAFEMTGDELWLLIIRIGDEVLIARVNGRRKRAVDLFDQFVRHSGFPRDDEKNKVMHAGAHGIRSATRADRCGRPAASRSLREF